MKFSYRIEGALVAAAVRLLRLLGPVAASNFCGAVARSIGPLLPVSKVAHRNLEIALPDVDQAGRRRIVRGVWDNLGRTAGEFPHVRQLGETASGPGWEIVGAEHIEEFVRRGGPGILVTGHLSNWEVLPLVMARQGVDLATLYRPADNPVVNALILELRRTFAGTKEQLLPKGSQGARQALAHLRRGGSIGLLQDQKMNDGIEAEFFGRKAMTASGLATLAVKMNCPVLPTYAVRIEPARFRVYFEPPFDIPRTADRTADILALTQAVNDRLEAWIRAAPESWLWLHRRWPKETYADLR